MDSSETPPCSTTADLQAPFLPPALHWGFPAPLQHVPPSRACPPPPQVGTCVPHPKASPFRKSQHLPGNSALTGNEARWVDGHDDVGLQQEVRQGLQQGFQKPQHTHVPMLGQHLPGTGSGSLLCRRPQNIPVPAKVTAPGCPTWFWQVWVGEGGLAGWWGTSLTVSRGPDAGGGVPGASGRAGGRPP